MLVAPLLTTPISAAVRNVITDRAMAVSAVRTRTVPPSLLGFSRAQVSGQAPDSSMNSFAMIFGRCVWIPPSPKAALAALGLFFGIGINTEPDAIDAEAVIANQYIVAGKSQSEAAEEVARLKGCFVTYEAPPENRKHHKESDMTEKRTGE
jgi:hypothetical protein